MTQILSILALDSKTCFGRRKTGKMVFENQSCSVVGAGRLPVSVFHREKEGKPREQGFRVRDGAHCFVANDERKFRSEYEVRNWEGARSPLKPIYLS